MRARYYNVDIKRFMNQDVLTGTLERISSLNRYAYVEGNPVSYLDPFGLAKAFLDDLHKSIEKVQQNILILMGMLLGIEALGIATENLALEVYAAYYFIFLYKASAILSIIDAVLYTYDAYTDESTGELTKDISNAVMNLASALGPVKEMSQGENVLLSIKSRFAKIEEAVTSFLTNKKVNEVLEK